MEMIIKSLSFKDYLKDVNCHFTSGLVTGVTGISAMYLLDVINGDLPISSGRMTMASRVINDNFYRRYPAEIAYIREDYPFFTNKVFDEFIFTAKYRNYQNDLLKTKIVNLLTLVGLDDDYLYRDIKTLSTSEKIALSIAVNIIFDPKVIIFGDIIKYLDKNNLKKLVSIINNLKESGKIIIFYSDDVDFIYAHTDVVLIFKDNTSILFGPTDKVYSSDRTNNIKGIKIPSLVKITYLAKKKKVKLSYHKDVRDIIKDVYKHV